MASGETAAKMAFQRVFGEAAGTAVFVLIVISCLGTLNGLMLACCRSLYALAARNQGPKAELFRQVDSVTNMPTNSAIASLALDGFWLLYFYGANLTSGWFGQVNFDSSELPIVTIYAMYIPMFIMFIVKSRELNGFKRFVMPILGLGGCRRYNNGPHQYTDSQMRKRIRKLRWEIAKYGGVDIILTHAPPKGVGDGEDRAHQGFECFLELMDTYRPKYLLHGHVHMSYGHSIPREIDYNGTKIINAYERYTIEIPEGQYKLKDWNQVIYKTRLPREDNHLIIMK